MNSALRPCLELKIRKPEAGGRNGWAHLTARDSSTRLAQKLREAYMLSLFVLYSALGLLAANTEAPRTIDSLESQTARRAQETPLTLIERKPNEIKSGRFTLSGIAVQLATTDNVLQLISPFAPAEYGWAEQSVVWEPGGTKTSGLKIFSIEF